MLDFAFILSHLIEPFFFLILFTFVISFFKSAYFKGKFGEFLVNTNNKLRLDSSIYTKLSDVTIRLDDGSSTQIDHIIFSKFGIFVIETKNMKGWIFGSEHQKQWRQSIYGKNSSFQNPLLQNHRHIKALEEVMGVKKGLYSIVTFVGESRFKTVMPSNVFEGGGYITYIKSFQERIFSERELLLMRSALEKQTLVKSRATNREHIDSLKKGPVRSKELYQQDPKIICRRCSSVMVERINKKTQEVFLGCSAYPHCRQTEKL